MTVIGTNSQTNEQGIHDPSSGFLYAVGGDFFNSIVDLKEMLSEMPSGDRDQPVNILNGGFDIVVISPCDIGCGYVIRNLEEYRPATEREYSKYER